MEDEQPIDQTLSEPRPFKKVVRCIGWVVAYALLGLASLWAVAALWFDAARNRWLAGGFVLVFVAACVGILVFVRPKKRGMLAAWGLFALMLIWWQLIPASNSRQWQPDVAMLPRATIDGNRLTIENVRNFDYHSETDYTEHWETRQYDLSKLQGVDMFLSYWGPSLICHTIASWQFADGPPLAISIETRKEVGETYSAVKGFFRQFELYYVIADESDVIRLRTNYRGEHVYLYHMLWKPEQARALLIDYLESVNKLSQKPQWYNALTHNCTTTIRDHAMHAGGKTPWDWRILANGYIDEMSYERGQIATTLPFDEMRRRSEITDRAKSSTRDDFSRQIRVGLPAKD